MSHAEIDYYAILEVKPEATLAEITRAYRMRSLKVHPDRNPDNPQAAQLFHELRIAADILSDPVQRSTFDAVLASRNAKKLRFAAFDNKRKAFAEELERGEQEFKRRKAGEQQEKGELERLKEEGRKMREQRQSKEDGEREREIERLRDEEKERKRREKQKDKEGAVELGPLDTTLKVKWLRTSHPTLTSSETLSTFLSSQFLSSPTLDVDSIVLSGKFLANPNKGKWGSGVVAFKTLSAALKVMEASGRWDGVEVTWAAGEPPAILNGTAPSRPLTKEPSPPPRTAFPASLLVDTDEEDILAKLRAREKERERMMEEMRRQDEAEEAAS